MRRRLIGILAGAVVLITVGCQSGPPSAVTNTISPALRAPATIQRMLVLYPSTANGEWTEAYRRLDAEVFKLKESRPLIRIVDRRHLPALIHEQTLQLGGLVSDSTAIRVGRVLGVDAVLSYQIEGPTMRDLVRARFSDRLPPVVVTSQVILVETAEVVYHNVVTTTLQPDSDPWHTDVRAALERAVQQTAADLQQAFR